MNQKLQWDASTIKFRDLSPGRGMPESRFYCVWPAVSTKYNAASPLNGGSNDWAEDQLNGAFARGLSGCRVKPFDRQAW
jgi:hypothetical protein